jgi:putative PIN family toxin of toxin-antitoxin system
MASERPRLVVDTNVWISFLIGKTLTGLGELLVDNRIVLLQCDELFSEMLEVLERPKFRQYFSPDDIRELVELINLRAEWVDVVPGTQLCRDPKDDFLLDLCLLGMADFLVTGDEDLLVLGQIGTTSIVHYRDLMARL